MHPPATLFIDVCVQNDFWPDGAWPLVSAAEMKPIVRLCVLAAELGVRRHGIVCLHGGSGPAAAPGVPLHCAAGRAGSERPAAAPLPTPNAATDSASGCGAAPDVGDGVAAFARATA